MAAYIKSILVGTWSLIAGLAITLRFVFKPVVTCQYPHAVPKIPDRYRGHIDFVYDPATCSHKCIVCGMCQKTCPSGCISLEGEKLEGAKKKTLSVYQLNFTTCSLCGLCVEACPTGALTFSKEYNLAGFDEKEYHFDLIKRLQERP
ncbi:MAG: NADH-quinone oxidoreductase subunit I [Deltaproteobacteria bacterium]|jgi:NADH-quinone oxidoreductase subunit I|nr:NADH-quinone oxidoreductase subunit I [Deltaproteobacteria bacterium]